MLALAHAITQRNRGRSVPADWDGAHARGLADEHVGMLRRISGGAVRVIDKTPDNLLHLGLIAALLPGARVIHVRRDPRDVGLSNYFQHYQHGNAFAYDLGHIGARVRGTSDLARHWLGVLPIRMLEIEYEALVADLEGQSRRLIEFLGLNWEPSCLDFHRTERAVLTASTWQVRQPLYSRSVGRWRHYERHLDPMLAALRTPDDQCPDSEVPRHCEERSDEAIQGGAAGEAAGLLPHQAPVVH